MRFAIFASGSGSNFQAIVESYQKGEIAGELACLFCDQPGAYVIERAQVADVPYYVLGKKKEETKAQYEEKILSLLKSEEIDLIVLAGYMKIIGNQLLEAFPNRIVNLHPSLLPKFPGKQGILDAYQSDEKQTGITIHLVDQGVDTGPIIFQASIEKQENETLESLESRIHELEHRYFPKIIGEFIREKTINDK